MASTTFTASHLEEAANAFCRGALEGLTTFPEFWTVTPPADFDGGDYERAAFCAADIFRQRNDLILATYDRCLAEIAARRDISQFLEAAE
jgi:hypothetical protein